jgi:hypothetical protein
MNGVLHSPKIRLTVLKADNGQAAGIITLKATQLLGYERQPGFTKLWVSGCASLDVREGTDEIDRRVRLAVTQESSTRRAVQ